MTGGETQVGDAFGSDTQWWVMDLIFFICFGDLYK